MKNLKQDLFQRMLTEEERGKYAHMNRRSEETREKLKTSLKSHLSTLNDGVIAIIITIMLLELPSPTEAGYQGLLWAILVFFISFFVVADFWYENKRTFEIIDEVDHLTMILNFVFLAVLGLIPVMTKWIMRDTTCFAVVNYGVVYLLTLLVHNFLHFSVLRKRFRAHSKLFVKLTAARIAQVLIPNLLLIALGFFFPKIVMILYLALPVIGFLQPEY